MKIAKEDLLWVRNYIAEKYGKELTPQQVINTIMQAAHVEVVNGPGLVSAIKRIKREMNTHGDSSPC